jgi:hypothetical protein
LEAPLRSHRAWRNGDVGKGDAPPTAAAPPPAGQHGRAGAAAYDERRCERSTCSSCSSCTPVSGPDLKPQGRRVPRPAEEGDGDPDSRDTSCLVDLHVERWCIVIVMPGNWALSCTSSGIMDTPVLPATKLETSSLALVLPLGARSTAWRSFYRLALVLPLGPDDRGVDSPMRHPASDRSDDGL